jgi:hypothetical protein
MSKIAEPYVRWRERYPEFAAATLKEFRWAARAVPVLVILYVAFHVIPALIAKGNPPLACQLLSGHWSIWGGWRCG